jgi:folate-dependent tRNA-U54 methylase TrmFO/GidA
MNANFGIMADLDFPHKKKERKSLYAKRALDDMKKEIEKLNER